MTDMRTEEEQVEAIKNWWQKNGTSLIVTLVLVTGGWFGWNGYQDNKQAKSTAASVVYTQMIDLVAQPLEAQTDATRVQAQALAEQLTNDFKGTVYADFGQLFIARFAADAGEFDGAIEHLQQLIASSKQPAVVHSARARLATLQIQTEQYDAALATLSGKVEPAFMVQFETIKGDAHWLQGNREDALAAYTRARAAAQDSGASTQTLQRKIDHLVSVGEA